MRLAEETQARIDAVVERLALVSGEVGAQFQRTFETFERDSPEKIQDNRYGFIAGNRSVDFKKGAIKYVLDVRGHTAQKLRYLPYFDGVTSALDIGVGPAQLFMLLQDGLGIRTHGIDRANSQGEFIYQALWKAFGIIDKISVLAVKAYQDIPIPDGTDAVLAFWSNFDSGWGYDEHTWYIDYCRSKGAKHVYWRFNSHVNYDVMVPFYRDRGARFPREGDPGFCILDL